MAPAGTADFTVRIVDDAGEADHSVVVVDGGTILSELEPADGDVLTFDQASGQWIAAAAGGGGGLSEPVTFLEPVTIEQTNHILLDGERATGEYAVITAVEEVGHHLNVGDPTLGKSFLNARAREDDSFVVLEVPRFEGEIATYPFLYADHYLDGAEHKSYLYLMAPKEPFTTTLLEYDDAIFRLADDAGTLFHHDIGADLLTISSGAGGGQIKIGTGIGFFGTSPIAKPTGVAVDAAGIHAALVSLGLIAA